MLLPIPDITWTVFTSSSGMEWGLFHNTSSFIQIQRKKFTGRRSKDLAGCKPWWCVYHHENLLRAVVLAVWKVAPSCLYHDSFIYSKDAINRIKISWYRSPVRVFSHGRHMRNSCSQNICIHWWYADFKCFKSNHFTVDMAT